MFAGSYGQKGHGLGSLLSGLFRSAFPMIKRGLSTFGKHALRTGLEIATDVVDGESFGNSARRRVPDGIKRFTSTANFSNQSGSGRRRIIRKRSASKRKKKSVKKHTAKKRKRSVKKTTSKKRRRRTDIFS